jgi:hypothetical protein
MEREDAQAEQASNAKHQRIGLGQTITTVGFVRRKRREEAMSIL